MSYPKEFYDAITSKVITRFPPENSGCLHLGHVKALEVDFGFASERNELKNDGSMCILRFDDTNPSAEKQEYYNNIKYDIEWLGYKPCFETSTSDYFGLLYDFAILLIKKGDAYVCQLLPDQILEYRKNKIESPWKFRPIDESLELFEEMKNGKYGNNDMTLRMKGDLDNPNTTLWDFIMYRIIKDIPHGKTANEWCIYPTYDYSHGIIDSIEGITHSFCTKEYEVRREQYYWFLDKLNMRKPFVYEFAKLDITNETMSKRKINEMIKNSIVCTWDDARLLTVSGLRRRGYLPEVLREFCRDTGVTKTEAVFEGRLILESKLRDRLNVTSPRKMVVFSPLKLHITNYPDTPIYADAKDFPMFEDSVLRDILITNDVYIDSKEFKEIDEKSFYGLAPNKTILLKYGAYVEYESYDKMNNTVFVKVVPKPEGKKVKGVLNWVNANYTEIFTRQFDGLRNWTQLCYAEESINVNDVKVLDKFQFEKHGYYCLDPETLDGKMLFNETVKLKSGY
jgi:glutaminyl-tRNA synthetase